MAQHQQQQQVIMVEQFFKEWLDSHRLHIETLQEALRSILAQHDESSGPPASEHQKKKNEELLLGLIRTSLDDYRIYYNMKRRAVEQDVFQVLHPLWKSSLESAFMWMGGWRPSSAFRVALSQSSHHRQQESGPIDSRFWSRAVELTGLSHEQLLRVEAEKTRSTALEDEISAQAGILQQSIAERSVVKIAQGIEYIDATIAFAQLKGVMRGKVEQLGELILKADALRLQSLECMVGILSPLQAARFLVTAEVLKLAFNHVGEMKDRRAAEAE